jgi:hypothetical protein
MYHAYDGNMSLSDTKYFLYCTQYKGYKLFIGIYKDLFLEQFNYT